MALNNIKNLKKDSGFTIVELLIVIVVIAILATISIVAYSGIQTRAKNTKAQANAAQVQKAAEAYYADSSVYPSTRAHFTSGNTVKLGSGVTILLGATAATFPTLDATNGEGSVIYRYVGAAASSAGACVFYYDFTNSVVSSAILMGNATTATCSSTAGNTPTV